jgi:hypothetical protein
MSSMTTLSRTVTLELITCSSCDVAFAMPAAMLRRRRDDGQVFWCPNGCQQVFRETQEQRLAREVEHLRASRQSLRDQLAASERSNRAMRGVVTKTKRRVGNGVCPCCNRHFVNLERHMKGQHPSYGDESSG